MSRLTWHYIDLKERDAWGLGCSHSLTEKLMETKGSSTLFWTAHTQQI